MIWSLYVVWKEENNTGIPIIDEQHRFIVSNINSLYYFMQKGESEHLVNYILEILQEYTKIHFNTEEQLLKEANYPEIDDHISYHRSFNEKVSRMLKSKNDDYKVMNTLKFLRQWWMYHINNEDKKYVPYVTKNLSEHK